MATDELRLKISVEGSAAKKALKEIRKEAIDTGREVESQGKAIANSSFFRGAAITAGLYVAGKAIKGVADGIGRLTEKADYFSKSSFVTGLGTEKLQKIASIIKIGGGSFESFSSAFTSMSKFLSGREFGSFSEDMLKAFSKLGINATQYTSPLELLMDTMKELKELPAGERGLLADKLGISQEFVQAFEKGAKYSDDIKIHNQETLDIVEKLNEEQRALNERVGLFWEKLSAKTILPLRNVLTKTFARVLEKASEWQDKGYLPSIVSDVGASSSSSEGKIRAMLKADGWTDVGINAVLGNLREESGFNPAAYNESEGAVGIAQWRLGRKAELQKRDDWNTLEGQVSFMLDELKTKFPSVYSKMKNATNLGYATSLFDKQYEISSGEARGRRLKYAGEYAGLSDDLIQRSLEQYAPQTINSGGNITQNNTVYVNSSQEGAEFTSNALGRGAKFAQATVNNG